MRRRVSVGRALASVALQHPDLAADQWLVEQARALAHELLRHDPATVDAHLARWLGGREEFLKV